MKTLSEIKTETLEILSNVDREGMVDLIEFLLKSDYFTAPASTKFHDSSVGGLSRHSLLVYNLFKQKMQMFDSEFSEDSIAICGLLHDICKVDFYKVKSSESATKAQITYIYDLLKKINTGENAVEVSINIEKVSKAHATQIIDHLKTIGKLPLPEEKIEWTVEDSFPFGHGEKSVVMLQKYIDITLEEMLAIRWHMSFSDPSVSLHPMTKMSYSNALDKSLAVVCLFTADFEASQYSKWRTNIIKS